MKIMLTGHKGFIGSHLLNRLTKHGSVVGFDIVDDVKQNLLTCEFKEDFDSIVHLAGRSGVRESIDDPAS